MTVYDPSNLPALRDRLDHQAGLIVACYCAAWCDTCRDYQPEFNRLSAQWPEHTFVWIDIEDHPELLDDHDIEDFPTILIQSPDGTLFFGEQLPYISHVDRLIKRFQNSDEPIAESGPSLLRNLIRTA